MKESAGGDAPAPRHPVVNLVVDVGFNSQTPMTDAERAYHEKLYATVEQLRRQGIPTVWISMSDRSELHAPQQEWPAANPQARNPDDLAKLDFVERDAVGPKPFTPENRDFMMQYGPRDDEYVFPKAFFDALQGPETLERRADYLGHQRAPEYAIDIHKALRGQQLRDLLKEWGTEHVLLEGGNADVCVMSTAMGAAMDGIKATVLTDLVVSRDDPAAQKGGDFHQQLISNKVDNILHHPEKLASDMTHHAFADPELLTAEEKAKVSTGISYGVSAEVLPALARPVVPVGKTAAPEDPELSARIKGYADYFANVAETNYDLSAPGKYRLDVGAHDWKPPMEAIEKEFDTPWAHSPGWDKLDRDTFRPAVAQWLADNHITGLNFRAHGYNGWTAGNFTAQIEGSPLVQNFRIGSEEGRMHHFVAPWNPLLMHTDAQNIFVAKDADGAPYKLSVSRGPIATMVPPRQPPGFDQFLNDHVLKDTPFKIIDHKDLSVLFDGTPVYGDPDSVGFRTPALAKLHAKDVNDPAWQQKIMATIHENSEKLNLPQQLRWVVETSPGVFAPKQGVVNPDPLQRPPQEKKVVRLQQAEKPGQPAPQGGPKEFTVRAAGPGDENAVAGLLGKNYFKDAKYITAEQDAMTHEHAKGYLNDPSKKMFLAFDGDKPVGFAAVVPDDKRGGLLIDGLFTRKEYEGKGIASKLLGQCESYAVSQGHPELHLSVEAAKTDVKSFYEKRGWKADAFTVNDAEGAHTTDIDPGNSRVATHLMRKPLAEAPPAPDAPASKFLAPQKPSAPPETKLSAPAEEGPAGRGGQAGTAVGFAAVGLDLAEKKWGRAAEDTAMQVSLNPSTYKAIAQLTEEAGTAAKMLGSVAKKIPLVGAAVTVGFVAYEVGADIYNRNYGQAGAALAAGTAETLGNMVGLGVGDLARETVREGVVLTAGEEFAPNKSGLRMLGERAYDLGAEALSGGTQEKRPAAKANTPKP